MRKLFDDLNVGNVEMAKCIYAGTKFNLVVMTAIKKCKK